MSVIGGEPDIVQSGAEVPELTRLRRCYAR
jgi:hypothetical protein